MKLIKIKITTVLMFTAFILIFLFSMSSVTGCSEKTDTKKQDVKEEKKQEIKKDKKEKEHDHEHKEGDGHDHSK